MIGLGEIRNPFALGRDSALEIASIAPTCIEQERQILPLRRTGYAITQTSALQQVLARARRRKERERRKHSHDQEQKFQDLNRPELREGCDLRGRA